MTWVLFAGCGLIAFGPPLAFFIIFLAKNGPLVVLSIGSSFFWLVSLLVSSIIWYVIYPLRPYPAFIIPVTVLLQELMRWLFYRLYLQAKRGLERGFAGNTSQSLALDYLSASLAIGFGFGITQGIITYGTMLAESIGPGSLFGPACSGVNLFLLSAILALAGIAMHVFLSIISFDAFKPNASRGTFITGTLVIVLGHLAISLLTLLNQSGGSCVASVVLVYVAVLALGGYAVRLMLTSPELRTKRQ